MTKPPLPAVPVRTAEELTERWEQLLDPPVFSRRSLWLTVLDGGLMTPIVIPVDDVPAAPDRSFLTNLAAVSETIVESQCTRRPHVALALCRPGRVRVTHDDEAWERGIAEAFGTSSGTWSLHLAAGGTVVPMVDMP
jgi:hypothetical protein